MPQLDLFQSIQNRDIGMEAAKVHADSKELSWSEQAYKFLLGYCKTNKEFMAEEVRVAATDVVPEPPSKRAWGSIFMKAAKNEVIKRIGFKKTTNPKAHRTPATLWQVV